MAAAETQVRHVFHAPTLGWDRVHAWQEATGQPAFVWGGGAGARDAFFFGSLRRSFADWIGRTGGPAAMTLYHDGMGADALGPLDPARHKVLFLHQFFPRWERHFEWQLRCTGLIMTTEPAFSRLIREKYAWIPERFIESLAGPVLAAAEARSAGATGPGRRTGIWLQGRPWRRYGNRLRAIVDRWVPGAGQLEIIVDGGGPPAWARRESVLWSPSLPLEFALHRLHTWDSVLLLDDYSLDAPWLLQALALDCFPLVPDGDSPALSGSWGTGNAPSPYPWGDLEAAIGLLGQWREERADLIEDFRDWREGLLARHDGPAPFRERWQAATQALLAQRPPKLRPRKPLAPWMPLSWYERVLRLRTLG